MANKIEEKAIFIGINPEKLVGIPEKEMEKVEKAIEEAYNFISKGVSKK